MRLIFALFCSSCILGALAADTPYPSWVYDAFEDWAIQWDKSFSSAAEKEFRVGVFYSKLLHIEEVNARQDSYRLGLNGFSHLTTEEFVQMHTGYIPSQEESTDVVVEEESTTTLPSSVDWTDEGAVTGVKNQGQCGSCWSFSTTGALEGLNVISYDGTLTSYSEQQLVDCSGAYGNYGCNGGSFTASFKYTKAYGIEKESTYPYTSGTGKSGTCDYKKSEVAFTNKGQKSVYQRSSTALKTAVYQQPASIAIDAEAIESYKSGIFNDVNCGTSLDHAVLCVGYNDSDLYFKVKNSWGTTWGEDGYIRMAMLGDSEGECGMYMDVAYPT